MKNLKVEKWIIFHAFLLIFTGILSLAFLSYKGIVIIGLSSFIVLLYCNKQELKRLQPFGGYANWITFFRLILLILALCLEANLSDISLFLLLSFAIGLDGLDGWLARRFCQVSALGALFDKEVDSYFVLTCSMLLWIRYDFPIWIVGIGLLHYIYELILFTLSWQYLKIPANPVGKYVAAFLFVSLLLPILLPLSFAKWVLLFAALCTLSSFAISFFLKYKASINLRKPLN